jgi:hypothetical protein
MVVWSDISRSDAAGRHKNCRDTPRPDMPFSIPVAGAVFLTNWFTVLFAVLPFGVRSQHETGDIAAGTDPGAPVAPRLVGKAI